MKRLFYAGLQAYSLTTPLVDDVSSLLPETFHPLVELVVNLDLRRHLRAGRPNEKEVRKLLSDAQVWRVHLDGGLLGLTLSRTLENAMKALVARPGDTALVDALTGMVLLASSLPFSVDLQKPQNIYYRLMKTVYRDYVEKMHAGDAVAAEWVAKFTALGERLSIKVE